jgi:hypothetical protein
LLFSGLAQSQTSISFGSEEVKSVRLKPLLESVDPRILKALSEIRVRNGTVIGQPSGNYSKDFPDGRTWMLVEPLVFRLDKDEIVVPAGFVHDLASIPWFVQGVVQKNGPYSRAAVVHDFLYWEQGCSRSQSDRIMLLAMKASNVSSATQHTIYGTLVLLGGWAWDQNTKGWDKNVIRVIPAQFRSDVDTTYLEVLRENMSKKNIRNGKRPKAPLPYCTWGDKGAL